MGFQVLMIAISIWKDGCMKKREPRQFSLVSRHQSSLWNRNWYILKDNALYEYSVSPGTDDLDDQKFKKNKVCDIVLTLVKKLDNNNNKRPSDRFCFELIIPNRSKPIVFKARGPEEQDLWVNSIQRGIEKELAKGDPMSDELNKGVGKGYSTKTGEIWDNITNVTIRQCCHNNMAIKNAKHKKKKKRSSG